MNLTQQSYTTGAGGFGETSTPKTVAFTGAAGLGAVGTVALFTITGAVLFRLVCVCTESLVEGVGGGTIEVGITGATANLIAQTTSTNIIAGEIWHDAAPDAEIENLTVMAERIIADGNDVFATVGAQDITDGTLVFRAFWTPVTPGATVVAA